MREQFIDRCRLDDTAEVHHHHAIRQMLDDAEVVADEQIREVELLAQVHEQIENLRLDRHVERGHGFVAHQHRRLHRKRTSNADALALTAAELVRITRAQCRVETRTFELRAHIVVKPGAIHEAVNACRFAHDFIDAQTRVQARIRVLENHLHGQARSVLFLRRHVREVATVDQHFAVRWREQTRGDAAQRRFAAAGFTDQTDDFAGLHDQIDLVHGARDRCWLFEPDALQRAADEAGLLFTKALAHALQFDHGRELLFVL